MGHIIKTIEDNVDLILRKDPRTNQHLRQNRNIERIRIHEHTCDSFRPSKKSLPDPLSVNTVLEWRIISRHVRTWNFLFQYLFSMFDPGLSSEEAPTKVKGGSVVQSNFVYCSTLYCKSLMAVEVKVKEREREKEIERERDRERKR